jgi:hypothetical protein
MPVMIRKRPGTAVRRSGRTISAETAASLRQLIGLHVQTKAILDDCIQKAQALIDDSDQQEKQVKLARQWDRAPLS